MINSKYSDLLLEIQNLIEENKNLSCEIAKLNDIIITDKNFEEKLDNENKKLKEENEKLQKLYDFINNV